MTDDSASRIAHLQSLVTIHQRHLFILEEQCATYGIAVPPHMVMEKEHAAQQLQRTLDDLAQLNIGHAARHADESTLDDLPPIAAEQLPPFVVGPPVPHPRMFFGREEIVRRIFAMLQRPPLQNTVIIGPRRSGKTSLLHYLRAITRTPAEQLRPSQRNDWLREPERYRWLMADFQDARLSTRDGLLRHLLHGLGLTVPVPCTLDRCLDVLAHGIRAPTVVLLDELGTALQRYAELDDAFWESLRALGPQVNGNLGFVLASHVSPVQLARDSGHSSPFFNIFGYTTRLKPLPEQDARALIASTPVPFPEDDVTWILQVSQRWPILLQVCCRERLMALEFGEAGDGWRDEVLEQIEPYRHLLQPAAERP